MAFSRTVRHLRLRGYSRASMTRVGAALEDALRVSDLPGDGGRLVLVRTLALGVLDDHEGRGDLPRRLEAAMEAGSGDVRHGGDPAAARSNAVWFRDTLEAHARLAERVVAGVASDEWYWPLAVPGWRGSARGGIPDRLRVIARSLATLPEAPAAMPAWCAAVCEVGGADDLETVFAEGDGPAIAEAGGLRFDDFGEAGERRGSVGGAERPSPGMQPVEVGGGGPVGLGDRAALSTRTPVEGEALGESGGGDAVLEPVGGTSRTSAPHAPLAPGTETGRTPASSGSSGGLDIREGQELRPGDGLRRRSEGHRREVGGGAAGLRGESAAAASTPSGMNVPVSGGPVPGASARSLRDRGPAAWAQAPVTVAGGLPFLINVLSRLDFGPWLEGAPERTGWGVARRVLTRALTHADIPEADPAWALAIGDAGLGDSSVVERAADAWYAACGVWLPRFADIDLETLVLRDARLSVTPTHVDTWFALSQVDLSIRRAGLDIDPGWVPWMARVVAFHYDAEVRCPERSRERR